MTRLFRPRNITLFVWGLCAAAIIVSAFALWLHFINRRVDAEGLTEAWANRVLIAPLPAVLGALIAARRPRNPVGWLLLTGVAFECLAGFLAEYAIFGRTTAPGSLPGTAAALWVSSFIWAPAVAAFLLMVVLFPDGRLPSGARRWRVLTAAAVGASTFLGASMAVSPYPPPAFRPAGFVGL